MKVGPAQTWIVTPTWQWWDEMHTYWQNQASQWRSAHLDLNIRHSTCLWLMWQFDMTLHLMGKVIH